MVPKCLAVACLLGMAPVVEAQPTPSLEIVLERFRAYLTSYSQAYAATVATEVYTQTYGRVTAKLESEFAMVRVPGGDEWLGFRDVLRVNGKDVTGRPGRLAELFANPAGLSLGVASRIAKESARFNIGRVRRTVNNPAIVLEILDPRHHRRFRFWRGGEDRVGGIRSWVIRFAEQGRGTIVRDSGGRDEPVDGRVWIDPELGTLLRAALRINISDLTRESLYLDIVFGFEKPLEMWVPVRMHETYEVGLPYRQLPQTRTEQTGHATYADYRQFVVQSRIVSP